MFKKKYIFIIFLFLLFGINTKCFASSKVTIDGVNYHCSNPNVNNLYLGTSSFCLLVDVVDYYPCLFLSDKQFTVDTSSSTILFDEPPEEGSVIVFDREPLQFDELTNTYSFDLCSRYEYCIINNDKLSAFDFPSVLEGKKMSYIAGNCFFLSISEGGSGSDNEGGTTGGGTEGGSGDITDSSNDYSWFDFLKEGLATIINGITQFLSWFNPFSDNFILKGVLEFLGNILDYLNPFSDNFILLKLWDFLSSMLSYINPFSENFFGYKIINLLGDLLKTLFVPSEERITALTNTVSSKFGFVDSIKQAAFSLHSIIKNTGNAPKIDIAIGSTKYTSSGTISLDLSWYAPFKSYGDLVITGFCYASFLWRMFIKLPGIINGSAGSVEDVDTFIKNKGGKR